MNEMFSFEELASANSKDFSVDEEKISTFERTINSANIFSIEVGTNGICGGDTGHGSRTYLKFEDQGGTDMRIRVEGKGTFQETQKIEFIFGGDCELRSLVEALEFATKILKGQIKGTEPK